MNSIFEDPDRDQLEVVLGFEGEQKADLAGELGFAAFSYKDGLSPETATRLQGLGVVLWKDNDRSGISQQQSAAELIAQHGHVRSLKIFPVPEGFPESGDIVDAVKMGWDHDRILQLIEDANPFAAPKADASPKTDGQRENQSAKSAEVGSLITRCLSEIAAKPINWLWQERIARGKLTIIAGDPGLGKSQITASIAAVLTTGGQWPVDRQKALDSKLMELGNVAIVVIDPISAYLGSIDSHKNADVRGLLAPVTDLAARHNVAIVCISHLTKAANSKALTRVIGSLAFVAAARAAYLVAIDPQDRTLRLFLPMKNNLAPDHSGLAYRIENATVKSDAGPVTTSRIAWEPMPTTVTADEVQAESGSQRYSAVDDAADFLRETLADGPVEATTVADMAKVTGISGKTLWRASKVVNIQKAKEGKKGPWVWSLPPKMAKAAEDGHF